MQSFSLGAGLAALAFWGFIAAVVVAGIWYDIRKRESQQETIRRIVESGQPIDDQVMNRLLSAGKGGSERLDRAFALTAMIILPASLGLAFLALILGKAYAEAMLPILGAAALVACVGIGFFVAARFARRWHDADNGANEKEI
jgi:hypothetical protein